MTAPNLDFTWEQGEDFVLSMLYKEGDDQPSAVPVDLTGFSVRMDVVTPAGTRLVTFNSQALADVDPITTGSQADSVTEATLGSDGTIRIKISRLLTLPPGTIFQQISASTPVNVFNYDIFLRNSAGDQTKILKGQITVEKSYTLWP